MEKKKAKAVLEAILFTMGDSVEIDRLAAVIEEDKETTRRLLEEMGADYQKGDRGIGLDPSIKGEHIKHPQRKRLGLA